MTHPSYLELDRHALGVGSEELRSHIASCGRCGAHVAQLQVDGALPAWAHEPTRKQAAVERWPRFRVRWLGGLALAGAATAAVAIVGVRDIPAPPAYVAAKGMPTVAIYVLRDGSTALWNGTDALRPGDRIRLKVAPEGYGWLAVSALDSRGDRHPLHEARIAADGDYLLPESWRIDDAPGPERLHIALDRRRVDPSKAVWSTTLELPKERTR